jgi:chromosome condensin MukBEF MukE localization factor
MKAEDKIDDVMELPHMAEVFETLRRGKHISMRAGDLFHALKKHESPYEKLFAKLGFKMIHHTRDFFYFRDSSNFTDLSAKMAVFMFILVEYLADQGDAVEDTVMTRRFSYQDLPHLHGERYQTYMREAGVSTPDELAAVVRTMERFGFTRRMDSETFTFEVAIYRFLDLCMEMAAQAEKTDEPASEALDASGAES